MKKAIKTKLKLNNRQKTLMAQHAGYSRWVWNWGLAMWNEAYKAGLKPSANKLKKFYTNQVKPQYLFPVHDIYKGEHCLYWDGTEQCHQSQIERSTIFPENLADVYISDTKIYLNIWVDDSSKEEFEFPIETLTLKEFFEKIKHDWC